MGPALLCPLMLAATLVGLVSDVPEQIPRGRKLRLQYVCEIDHLPKGAKIFDLWVPMASDNERQTVRLLNERELREGRLTADKKFSNRIYYRRFMGPFPDHPDNAVAKLAPVHVELAYDVEFREHAVQ